jgi:hypothetical protein
MRREKVKMTHKEIGQLRAGLMDLLVTVHNMQRRCSVTGDRSGENAAYDDMKRIATVLKMTTKYEEDKLDQVYNAFPADKIEVIIE